MKMYLKEKIPFSRALLGIMASVILITGSIGMFFFYLKVVRNQYINNSSYNIVAIIQTCHHHEGLKTAYLAELLGLSQDKPTNIHAFDLTQATSILLSHPVIKSAEIKKIPPGTIYIDYSLRQPIGTVLDFSNTAFDENGVFFPFHPFYTPKKIPEIFFGIEIKDNEIWINNKDNIIVQKLLSLLEELTILIKNNYQINRIDLSKSEADSYGKRQIIVTLEEKIKQNKFDKIVLRLHSENFKEGIENFNELQKRYKKNFKNGNLLIDLRLSSLAFISEI